MRMLRILGLCLLPALCLADGVPDGVADKAHRACGNMVFLSFSFGKGDLAVSSEDKAFRHRLADRLYQDKRSFRWNGVVVDEKGSVLCADPRLPLERIARVTAEFPGQSNVPMTVHAVYIHYGALLLKPAKPLPAPVSCVSMTAPGFKLGDRFYRLQVMLVGHERYLQLTPEWVDLMPLAPTKTPALFGLTTEDHPFGGCLLLNDCGDAVGYQVDYDLWDGPDGLTTYHPQAIKQGDRLLWADFDRRASALRKLVRAGGRRLRFYFQPEQDDDDDDDSYLDDLPDTLEGKTTLTAFGLAVPGGRFFVPVDLTAGLVRRIVKVTLFEPGKDAERAVPFVGKFKHWGGVLVGGADKVAPLPLDPEAAPTRGELFLVHRVSERFGRLFDVTDYNRYYNVERASEDRTFLVPLTGMQAPAFLFDHRNKLLGFYMTEHRSTRVEAQASEQRVVTLRDIAADLLSPRKALDPRAVPDPKKEAGRVVWLGVEVQPVNRDLMALMNGLGPTQDGKVGLLVNHVYGDSPAAEVGLQTGDVLLSITVAGSDRPIFMRPENLSEGRRYYRRSFGRMSGLGRSGSGFWRSRRNALTQLLTKIGPDKKVRLRWFRAGKTSEAEAVLAEGPMDFESAEPLHLAMLGISLKPLTYEIRTVLRLPDTAPGLLVTRIEPGGPADVVGLHRYELITHLNDRPLNDMKAIKIALADAKAGEAGTVMLRAWRFGKSRIVTIQGEN